MPVVKVTNVTGIGLEPDIYPFRVISVKDVVGKFGPQIELKIKVTITDEDGSSTDEERTLWAGTDKTGPSSKFYQIAAALLNGGDAFAEGYEIDSDDFAGKRGQIIVAPVTDKDGKTKIDVTTYLPPKKNRAAAALAKAIDDA